MSCAQGVGVLPHATGATAELKDSQFRVVKKNLRGESMGFNLLGFLPIVPASITDAMDQVQSQVESEGRAIALINVTQERQTTYLILFSLPRVVVRADAIEFLDESQSN